MLNNIYLNHFFLNTWPKLWNNLLLYAINNAFNISLNLYISFLDVPAIDSKHELIFTYFIKKNDN